MKRLIAALAIWTMAMGLSGCGSASIKGSPETVIDECAELSTDEKATVEVTFTDNGILPRNEGDGVIFIFADNGTITAFFEDGLTEEEAEEIEGNRVTIIGEYSQDTSDEDDVYLRDCRVK